MLNLLMNFLFAKENEKLLLRCAFTLYLAIIVVGSIPGARAEMSEVASGYVLHSLAYACITLCLFCGYAGSLARKAAMSVGTIVLMGALDEFIQSFLPYRRGAVGDWMVDVTAAVVTATICCFILARRTASAS